HPRGRASDHLRGSEANPLEHRGGDGGVTGGVEVVAVEIAVARYASQIEQLDVELCAHRREMAREPLRPWRRAGKVAVGVDAAERRWADHEHVGRAVTRAGLTGAHDPHEPSDRLRNR